MFVFIFNFVGIIVTKEMNIIITGASKGIGAALAMSFAEKLNWRNKETWVFLFSRNKSGIEKVAKKVNALKGKTKAVPVVFDVTKDDVSGVFKSNKIKIDILVNNAGFLVNKPFEKITNAELLRVYETNVLGPFRLIQQLHKRFNKEAHVVNIASMGGYMGSVKFPGLSAYSSSKGALATLSECLAVELQPKGITVNCLCIGAVQTEMLDNAFPGYKAPLNANEMAEYISEFSLNGRKYYNGKVLPVSLSTP